MPEKSVFLSYRRTNIAWALAIYQNLTQHGYDVFFDYESIKVGDFSQVILGNLKARAHFVVLLTPSALERCVNADDWLRLEIETAIDQKRNIVPLMFEGFSFSDAAIKPQLTGKLALVSHYNALRVPSDFFPEAMGRLRERLNVELAGILHPISKQADVAAKSAQDAADVAPAVTEKALSAEEWFEKGFALSDNSLEEIEYYTEAIHLKPDYADAYNNRGNARQAQGDLAGAVQDYNEAIRLKPDAADAYYNRGNARDDQGDLAGAITDYNEAIRLKPDAADAYINRGNARQAQGDLAGAITDFNEAIRLQPAAADAADAYYNRGNARQAQGDLAGAITDYNEALRLKPDDAPAYSNRGEAKRKQGDLAGAVQDYNEAIRLKPDYADAYYNRGTAYWSLGKWREVVQDWEKTLALNPNHQEGKKWLPKARAKL